MDQRDKNEHLSNILTAAVVAVLLLSGVIGAQAFRGVGLFAPASAAEVADAQIRVETVTGNVDVERGGLSMALEEGTECRSGDAIYVRAGSSARLDVGGAGTVVLSEGVQALVQDDGAIEVVATGVMPAPVPSQVSTLDTSFQSERTCKVVVRCDTVLSHRDKLKAGKSKYVPEDGVIMAGATVPFEEGDTAFDVLKRACDEAGVQLEYAYTPAYDAYYVEGIANLYERDCGQQSGWMFKIDDVFPNYGPSKIAVKPGQTIEWLYSCEGAGDDVKEGSSS